MTEPRLPARIRVMLVDDHALVRAAVTQAITATDVEIVASVATAEEALQVAPSVRPDVLLVDIDLPGWTESSSCGSWRPGCPRRGSSC